MPTTENPSRRGLGQGGGELRPGGVPPEEVHRVGQRAPARQFQRVEVTVGLEHDRHIDAVGHVEAAGHAVGHVELGGHGHAVARPLTDRGHHLAREPGPVLERPTPPVVPAVEPGTQEGAQQVVVAQVDLEAVEAGFHGRGRRAPVVVGDAGDVGVRGRPRQGTRGAEAAARRQRRGAVGPGVGHRAGVADLGRGQGAGVVDGRREPGQSVEGRRTQLDAVPVGAPLGRDGQVGHRGHGHAAPGHPLVEGDQLVAHLPLRADALEGGGLDDAVLQGERTEVAPPRRPGVGWRAPRPPVQPPSTSPDSRTAASTASASDGWHTTRSGSHGSGRA